MKLDNKYNHPGELLKEKRLEKKLSLRGLSSIASISHTEISNIENGERERPSLSTLSNLCKALDLDITDISSLFNISECDANLVESNKDNISTEFVPSSKSKSTTDSNMEETILSQICSEISKKYKIKLSTDKFKNNYKFSNKSSIDYLCMTDNDMVIGVDFRTISSRIYSSQLQTIKGNFADFYFNFYSYYTPENMIYYVCFICESASAYDSVQEVYKDEFFRFMPVLRSKIYSEK